MLRNIRDRLIRAHPSASVVASFDEECEAAESEDGAEEPSHERHLFPSPRALHKEPTRPLNLAHPPATDAVLLLSGDETYTYSLRYLTDRRGNRVIQTMHCGKAPEGDGVVLDRYDRRGNLVPGYKFAFVRTLWVLEAKRRNEKGRVEAVPQVSEKGA